MSAPGSHIHGWMNEPELLWLHETAKRMEMIVEVGSLHGRSAYALASGCTGWVYCVDTWSTPGSREGFEKNLAELQVVPFQMESVVAAGRFMDGVVGMVFLDGDHSYESVKADIEAWLPKVRSGGLLCGHDYSDHEGFPGVKQAVRETFGGRAYQAELPGIPAVDSPIWAVDL